MRSFYEWCIAKYSGEDTPAGDLAGDIQRDATFPRTATDKETIFNYLLFKNACEGALRAFKNAYRVYQGEQNPGGKG